MSFMKRHLTPALCAVVLSLGACSSVTVKTDGQPGKLISAPQYEDRKNFFFWGLVGDHEVTMTEACGKNKAIQVQAQDTFLDGFLQFITLGIYSPRTARVWCESSL